MFLYLIRILLTHFLNSKIVRILYVYLNLEYYKPFIQGQNIALDIIEVIITCVSDISHSPLCILASALIQPDLENSYSNII